MNKFLSLLLSVLCLTCLSFKEGENTDLEKERKSTENEITGVEKLKSMFSGKEFYFEFFSVNTPKYAELNGNDDELLALMVDCLSKSLNFTETKNIFEDKFIFDTKAVSLKQVMRDEEGEIGRISPVTFLEGNIITFLERNIVAIDKVERVCYKIRKLNDKVILLLRINDPNNKYPTNKLLIEKDYIEEFTANIKPTEKLFDDKLVTKSIHKISVNEEEGTTLLSFTINNNSECNIKINSLKTNGKVIKCNDYDLAPHAEFKREIVVESATFINWGCYYYTVYGTTFFRFF